MRKPTDPPPAEVCPHKKWNIDADNIGTCANPNCLARRQFPWEKGGQIIELEPGKPIVKEASMVVTEKKCTDGRRNAYKNLPTYKRTLYLDENKDAIIADLFNLGRLTTRAKWSISGQGLGRFEKRHLTNEQKEQLTTLGRGLGVKKLFAGAPNNGNQVPPLPNFNNAWEPAAQLKWLEIYEKLLDNETDATEKIETAAEIQLQAKD